MTGAPDVETRAAQFASLASRVRHEGLVVDAHGCAGEVLFGTTLVAYGKFGALSRMRFPEDGAPGWLLPMIDLAAGRAALESLPMHDACVTLSIDLEMAADPRPGEVAIGLGWATHQDGPTAASSFEVRGDAGRLIAFGHGRFLGLPVTPPTLTLDHRGADAVGPLGDRLQLTTVEQERGRIVLDAALDPGMANPADVVHGGIQGAMMWSAAAHLAPGGSVRSCRFDFLDPVPIAAGKAQVGARIIRGGRSWAWVDASVSSRIGVGTTARILMSIN
jgi:acyl-coenzyme A thioesterase PaaI-like protein